MKQWAYIDTDVLKGARLRLGLSYEAVARLIPVSSKTWERWEKAGRVDRSALDRVAAVLHLEIERQQDERLRAVVTEDVLRARDDARLAGIERQLSETNHRLAEVLRRLPHPGPGQPLEESSG